jgi:tight adherence protein C
VELLLATTEAGLGPSVALHRSGEVVKGPLGEEVRAAVREVELGMPWQLAMEHLVDRTDVPSLRALAVALTRSRRLGSAVGVTLRRVMDELRRDRRVRAEEMARKAPLKMLFPLVFLILPAFLLLTVGPVVLATIRSLH